jgi:Domain of unknown function (DUF4145)
MTPEQLSKRFTELESEAQQLRDGDRSHPGASFHFSERWFKWATNAEHLIRSSFGDSSAHSKRFTDALKKDTSASFTLTSCKGIFDAAKSDFEGGYLSSLTQGISGEIFASLLNSARAALKEGYKDSAAVLAAAAFEDALKKIGVLHGLNVAEKELGNVIGALKSQQLLQGGAAKSAERYQNLRNFAMHGNWQKITEEEVGELIGFVEQLLIKHLS